MESTYLIVPAPFSFSGCTGSNLGWIVRVVGQDAWSYWSIFEQVADRDDDSLKQRMCSCLQNIECKMIRTWN